MNFQNMSGDLFSSPSAVRRNRLILVAVAFVLIVYILIRSWDILYPFVFGFVIAYLVLPFVNQLEKRMPSVFHKRNLARLSAILLVYLILFILLITVLYLFFSVVIHQVGLLAIEAPILSERIGEQINAWLKEKDLLEMWSSYQNNIEVNIRTQIESQLQVIAQRLLESFVNVFQQGATGIFDVLSKTVSFFLGILIIPIWLFYVLIDSREISKGLINLIPLSFRGDILIIIQMVDRIFNAFLRGQLILCVVVGVVSFIGLTIMGVPFAALLGIIAGVSEAIPMIGPLLGMIPALLIALSLNSNVLIYTFILYMLISQIESMWLKPLIMGDRLALHPALIMVVLFIGANLGGILGMVLSAPIMAVLRDLFKYAYVRLSAETTSPQKALEKAGFDELNLDEV